MRSLKPVQLCHRPAISVFHVVVLIPLPSDSVAQWFAERSLCVLVGGVVSQPLPASVFSSVKRGYNGTSPLELWVLKKTVHEKCSTWHVGSVSCCHCWNYDYFYYCCYNTRKQT